MTEQQARRRSVIIGAAGVGALAACSSPAVPDAQTPSSSTSTTAGSSSASTPSGSSSSTSTAAAGGTPTAEVPVGGGTIYADQNYVVTQPQAGTFKAFSAVCTHQGCAVASVSDGQIHCPCHGSAFDIATGANVAGPATSPLPAKQVTVSGDTFTVS